MPRDCVTCLSLRELPMHRQDLPQASPCNYCIMCIILAELCEKVTPELILDWFLACCSGRKKETNKGKGGKKRKERKKPRVLAGFWLF